MGGVESQELGSAGGTHAADIHVRHGPRHDAHRGAAGGRLADERTPSGGRHTGSEEQVCVRGSRSLSQGIAANEQRRIISREKGGIASGGDAEVRAGVIQRDDVVAGSDGNEAVVVDQGLVDRGGRVADELEVPAEEVHPAGAETHAAGGRSVIEGQPGAGQQGVGGGAAVQGDRAGITERAGTAHDDAAEVDGRRVESVSRGQGEGVRADLGQGLVSADDAAEGDVARGHAREGVDPAAADAGASAERDRTGPGRGRARGVDEGSERSDRAPAGDRARAAEAGAGNSERLDADRQAVQVEHGAGGDVGDVPRISGSSAESADMAQLDDARTDGDRALQRRVVVRIEEQGVGAGLRERRGGRRSDDAQGEVAVTADGSAAA